MDVENCPIFARVASVLVKQVRPPINLYNLVTFINTSRYVNVSPRLFNKH